MSCPSARPGCVFLFATPELDLMEGIKAEDVKEKLSYLEFDDSGGCVAGAIPPGPFLQKYVQFIALWSVPTLVW